MHKYGLGHWQLIRDPGHIVSFRDKRHRKRTMEIDPDLPAQGTYAYYEALFRKISLREGKFGDFATEAAARMAEKLGRYKQDVNNGDLPFDLLGNPGTLLHAGGSGMGLRFPSRERDLMAAHGWRTIRSIG